jgi:threonine dehydrogenase-like Zn-dependent dehydrogenase
MSDLNRRHFMMGASVAALQCTRVTGANDRIGVAVIGCGMRGLLGEVLQFSKDSNVEVTGVCDIWKQQREAAAERVKTTGAADPKLFAHFEEALASPVVDAVLISTPDHQHGGKTLGAPPPIRSKSRWSTRRVFWYDIAPASEPTRTAFLNFWGPAEPSMRPSGAIRGC